MTRSSDTVPTKTRRTPQSTKASVREGDNESSVVAVYVEPTPINRELAIAEIAYLLAEKRGFTPGYELDDWLAAEREVDQMLHLASDAVRDQTTT